MISLSIHHKTTYRYRSPVSFVRLVSSPDDPAAKCWAKIMPAAGLRIDRLVTSPSEHRPDDDRTGRCAP